MCERTIKLSLEQARKMYKKSLEMDELLLANFSKEELTKKELPIKFDQLGKIRGYVISDTSVIGIKSERPAWDSTRNIFQNHRVAKSALAMAQLSQLVAVYNDGWDIDYSNSNQVKFQIICVSNKIETTWGCTQNEFLTFKSAEIRDEFLKNFEPLIKQYFMID